MKKLALLFLTTSLAHNVNAQDVGNKSDYMTDAQLSRWVIDLNLKGGLSNQMYTSPNSTGNYLNALNANTGNLKFTNGFAYGADAQLGFFFGKKKHFGIGAGYMYLMQQGDATLDNFQIAYQSTDFKGSTFRQVVTGSNIKENLSITNMNIPVVLKYKNRFSKRWGFSTDAGILYNVQMQNDYTTHATFDYEAIYQFGTQGDATKVPVYDNSPTPSTNDWLITKTEFIRNNPNGNVQDYLNAKHALGYNVGLDQSVTNTKGSVSYPTGNIGFILQPSFDFFLSNHVAMVFGAYFLYQPFKTTTSSAYHITDGVGTYSSVLNNVTAVDNLSYGLNLGARFYFGKKHEKMAISSVEPMSPTSCGMYDGSIVIKGLSPNKPVAIDYKLNGVPQITYNTKVLPEGLVKIEKLGAGEYTDISATIRKDNATTTPVTLLDPAMKPPTEVNANPTEQGTCNGFVIFGGMPQGTSVTITYQQDGSAHAAYTGIVDANKLMTMNGLCAGKYTGVVATYNKCSANCPDFTLAAAEKKANGNDADVFKNNADMKVNLPAPESNMSSNAIDVSTPMLFDVNEYVLREEATPVINEAYRQLKKYKGSTASIEGNADSTGIEAKNRPLSVNRANAVKNRLVKKGISASRITTKGEGSKDPVATNKTYAGKQENRNAVITIIKK